MRPRKDLTPEQIDQVKDDLFRGKKRGQICKDRGYSYVQLQRAIGFSHRKKKTIESAPAPEIVVNSEVVDNIN